MQGTFLGKIESATFGTFEGRIGISFILAFSHAEIEDSSKTTWDPEQVKITQYTKWTEADRDAKLIKIMRYISKLLTDAKVDDVTKLAGKPIELVINEYNSLESWRILTEVL